MASVQKTHKYMYKVRILQTTTTKFYIVGTLISLATPSMTGFVGVDKL